MLWKTLKCCFYLDACSNICCVSLLNVFVNEDGNKTQIGKIKFNLSLLQDALQFSMWFLRVRSRNKVKYFTEKLLLSKKKKHKKRVTLEGAVSHNV